MSTPTIIDGTKKNMNSEKSESVKEDDNLAPTDTEGNINMDTPSNIDYPEKQDENSGKTQSTAPTPRAPPEEPFLDNADALNENLTAKTSDESETIAKSTIQGSGDSENLPVISDKGYVSNLDTKVCKVVIRENQSIEKGKILPKIDDNLNSSQILDNLNTIEQPNIVIKETELVQDVIDNKTSHLSTDNTVNDSKMTVQDGNNDSNINKGTENEESNEMLINEQPMICPSANINIAANDSNFIDELDMKMECNDFDDELELKWDEGNDNCPNNDDDEIVQQEEKKIECDVDESQDVERLVDESSMDTDVLNEKQVELNDSYINNDKDAGNDIATTSNIMNIEANEQSTTKDAAIIDTNIQTIKKIIPTNDITENIPEDTKRDENIDTPTLKNAEEIQNEPQNVTETPCNEQVTSTNDIISPNTGEISINDTSLNTSEISMNDSRQNTSNLIKKDHGLHKPDVMLEIPTQELIDIDDVDLSISSQSIDSLNNESQDKSMTDEKGEKEIIVKDSNDTVKESTVPGNDSEVIESKNKDIDANLKGDGVVEKEVPINDVSSAPSQSEKSEIQPTLAPAVSNEMTPDTADEASEVSDSLGLLAESSRVMEDDEDQEDDEEADEDDDFDNDESSNQMTTADHSEDSNAQQSESEVNREQDEKEIESPAVESDNGEFEFRISNIETQMEIDIESKDAGVERECVEEPTETAIEEVEQTIKEVTAEAEKISESIEQETPLTEVQTDIETVKLSDTSDNEADTGTAAQVDDKELPKAVTKEAEASQSDASKKSPSKSKKLEMSQIVHPVFNIVDLEESSSEDDIQEINKQAEPQTQPEQADTIDIDGVTGVNLPTNIEVMCTSAENSSEIVSKEGEVVISGVPKPTPVLSALLNTSEVSTKNTSTTAEPSLVIPDGKNTVSDKVEQPRTKPAMCLEIFSLDSDEDESSQPAKEQPDTTSPPLKESEVSPEGMKCINSSCPSGPKGPFLVADSSVQAYYDTARKRRSMVCEACAQVVVDRKQNLVDGIKQFCPLIELGVDKKSQELVEISDSESEDETEEPKPASETIGEKAAKLLEENLAGLINETWRKFNMDARLKETHDLLDSEIQKLESESREIDQMLDECQVATDKLRNDLYASFEQKYQHLPSIVIFDTPAYNYAGPENELVPAPPPLEQARQKRKMSSTVESPAKKPAIPLGYAPLDSDTSHQNLQEPKATPTVIENKVDDDKEVSVVKLSAEAAPADLPAPGEQVRPPLKVGMVVFAMRTAFGPWFRGKVLECQPKLNVTSCQYTMCRVKFEHKLKNPCKILSGRCLAYPEPADVRMTIGTRIIALFKDTTNNVKKESYYSGVVAEMPNPVNNYRYLVFFDDGYAQYVQHRHTKLVCESSPLVWEEVHPFSRQFVRDYLQAYPERPMVRLHEGQGLKTEWNGKWCASRVVKVDASLAQVLFLDDGRLEWIYRGSTRLAPLYLELQAAERHRQRPMPRSKAQTRTNMPYVEYTRSDEQDNNKQQTTQAQQQQLQNEEIRRQRAVAKKSTAAPPPVATTPASQQSNLDTVTSRVVYYTPKNAVKPYKMVPHSCGPKCRRTDVLSLKELRTYNPLAKPLLSGWERQIVRFKGHKEVLYRAPCGRRIRDLRELHAYLRVTHSELPVDLFDFHSSVHCLAEFVLNKCRVGKKDLSHGKENVPVPCVNYYDDSLPEFCSYNTERTPTAGVPLNLDPDFLCGCDCTDDCADKTKCACWKMTLEGARTIGLEGPNVGYVYKRLPEPLPSGIYECNSRCKCKETCLNRVAQHPLQLKLQVFKTLNRGWGIRALNDIPKGAFLCVYAGNLLTDATANLDGLNEGDEYLAELDYIEVVEQMKEGYEEDIPAADKKLDKKELAKHKLEDDEDDLPSSDEDDKASKSDKEDCDFRPGHIGLGLAEFNKALRKRERTKKEEEDKGREKEPAKDEDDCITISDDEEIREPSRFTAQAGMGGNEFISKYSSVRTLFGRDEACYIMDAKVQGNIGRYLNHSCSPNVFVQNVFVDTHDPRFPWVAFFALSHIKAGTELTWNYNYDVGSVPGKVLYCYCGAPNCRGRLL